MWRKWLFLALLFDFLLINGYRFYSWITFGYGLYFALFVSGSKEVIQINKLE